MPKLNGILETALYVKDLQTAAGFYRNVFDLKVLSESDRLIALNVAGQSVLLLFKTGATSTPYPTAGGVIPAHTGHAPTHFAFAIAIEDVEPWKQRLAERGVAIESIVTWPSGVISLYCRDPDQNLVELITPGFWAMG